MGAKPVVVWFRDDLRLGDHPALAAAAASGAPVLPVYVLDGESPGVRPLGGASRWWLHGSLAALAGDLEAIGGALHLFTGPAARVVPALAVAAGAGALHFNRRYGGAEREVDAAVRGACEAAGIAVREHRGSVLHEPDEVLPKSGGFYKVFTPYWKAAQARPAADAPLPAPKRLEPAPCPPVEGGPVALPALGLRPAIPWDREFFDTWRPGEAGAREALGLFLRDKLSRYATDRDLLALTGSSRLSPHLRFGEISPRQVAAALADHGVDASAPKFAAELAWRDFNTMLLSHAPDLATVPFRKDFARFPNRTLKPAELRAWQRGRTGYPIVDAGMRQLWRIGTMHNRVRMIAASFLVKHLLADWRLGEQWFWDTLCDADPANNPVNWQWVAGCGNDPVPYFRVFNPVLQGEKFDADGAYVRQWVPELAGVPDRFIHKPWEAPPALLAEAGVTLGRTYPAPMVDHVKARARALDALKRYRAILEQAA